MVIVIIVAVLCAVLIKDDDDDETMTIKERAIKLMAETPLIDGYFIHIIQANIIQASVAGN